jgi:hypothetical protein
MPNGLVSPNHLNLELASWSMMACRNTFGETGL